MKINIIQCLLRVIFTISVCLNILVFKTYFNFQFMPLPDKEVTDAFNEASRDVVATTTFTLKWMNKYYVIIETTKEGKGMLEKLAKKDE